MRGGAHALAHQPRIRKEKERKIMKKKKRKS